MFKMFRWSRLKNPLYQYPLCVSESLSLSLRCSFQKHICYPPVISNHRNEQIRNLPGFLILDYFFVAVIVLNITKNSPRHISTKDWLKDCQFSWDAYQTKNSLPTKCWNPSPLDLWLCEMISLAKRSTALILFWSKLSVQGENSVCICSGVPGLLK